MFLGGGFKCFLFSSLSGEMIQFDEYYSNGLVQPPTRKGKYSSNRYFFFRGHVRFRGGGSSVCFGDCFFWEFHP